MNHLKRLALALAIASIIPSWSYMASAHLCKKEQSVLHDISINANGEIKRTTLAKAMDFYKVPAISFAVIDRNQITWADSIGYIDADHRHKVDNDTLFQAGSMSKSVAAITALSLVEHGFLTLDENALPLLKGWNLPKPLNLRMNKLH
ncbi:serine hydrolase [Vibrio profundum]|uniref:serine hydrolase n=1 Tax=Vibrio profundum TaxID=2910247 RepID=UPI003D09638F